MAIPINKYVDIFSSAGGSLPVNEKEPIGRFFTTNKLAPIGKVLEFSDSQEVLDYFGSTSNEYEYANKYFSFVSKRNKRPKRISFAGYFISSDSTKYQNSYLMSGITSFEYNEFKSLGNNVPLTVKFIKDGVITKKTINLDFSKVSSLNDVALELERMNAIEDFGNLKIEVDYTTNYNGGRFLLTATSTASPTTSLKIDLLPFEGALAEKLGIDASKAIVSKSADGTNTISQEVERVMDLSDNCYTFTFIEDLNIEDMESVANWNTNANSQYIYMIWAKSYNDANTYATTLEPYDCAIIFDNLEERQVYQPMAAGACIDFSKENASINFMYQQYPIDTPTVTERDLSDELDGIKVNYYGATQTFGKEIAFFQRGKCLGNFADMSVAFNAIWLKNSIIVNTLNLFLINDSIPANEDGKAKIVANLNKVWAKGVYNGAILQNKILNAEEKAYIEAQTNDEDAWQQVYQKGYWFDCNIKTDSNNGEKYFSFKLIYGAADQIRKVEGTNIAITTAR